jgi:hypothetical protein
MSKALQVIFIMVVVLYVSAYAMEKRESCYNKCMGLYRGCFRSCGKHNCMLCLQGKTSCFNTCIGKRNEIVFEDHSFDLDKDDAGITY